MNRYTIDSHIDSNKIFIINRSEIEGRWDAEYYKPEINALEKKVRALSSKKLRNFINNISSGATPSVKEEEKFYADKETGIPFLRVQNLQTNGKIALNDVKYINTDTHENYLKRSQVGEHDLLVKITGVGRMAIASVAPDGFVGNTNQHMIVIRTDNKDTSEYLAKYLNLDVVEKLASRRSTGGTRPALDYPALKSIPIIEGIDFSPIQKAEKIKQQKEAQAATLLASIDDYLLGELGITLPEQNNSLQSRMFTIQFSEIDDGRLDPDCNRLYYRNLIAELDRKFKKTPLRNLCLAIFQGVGRDLVDKSDYTLLKVKNIKQNNEINFDDVEFVRSAPLNKILINNDIISPFIGEAIRQTKFSTYNKKEVLHTIDSNTGVIRVEQTKNNSNYVCDVLNSKIGTIQISKLIGGGGVPFLGTNNVKKIFIPVPPLEKQNEIAEHIKGIRTQAKQLQQEAQQILEQAKKDVEQMILEE